jgi:phospholipid/cholesterol/gamma-HCH transport system ATP-binding protein
MAEDLPAEDVVNEEPVADTANAGVVFEPPPEGDPEEYRYHLGTTHASKVPAAIEFIDVHKSFGRNHVLRGLNMEVPEGQVSMIIGPSGTGKSVCIKHIVGLLYPDEGDVIVHGQSIPSLADAELFELRKKFGVLFQDGALFVWVDEFVRQRRLPAAPAH